MKIVVKDANSVAVPVSSANYAGAFFLAQHGQDFYVLLRDDGGWTFRSARNSAYSHSGKHHTPRAAVERAISALPRSTKIFQFDNFVELAQYVATHTKP